MPPDLPLTIGHAAPALKSRFVSAMIASQRFDSSTILSFMPSGDKSGRCSRMLLFTITSIEMLCVASAFAAVELAVLPSFADVEHAPPFFTWLLAAAGVLVAWRVGCGLSQS